MADGSRSERLDQPREAGLGRLRVPRMDPEVFGRGSEAFARFMGTPAFLVYMTIFVAVWLGWNTLLPAALQFDPRSLNYTLLTLILSLQASYAAPLILLAQNRQDDRDRVALEQDRARNERNLADTEYLTREVAALRLALRDVATRDFLRSELRDLLEEMREPAPADPPDPSRRRLKPRTEPLPVVRPRPARGTAGSRAASAAAGTSADPGAGGGAGEDVSPAAGPGVRGEPARPRPEPEPVDTPLGPQLPPAGRHRATP